MNHSNPSRRNLTLTAACILAVAWLAGGCGPSKPKGPPPKYDFEIEVQTRIKGNDQNHNPLPAVPVLVAGQKVGFTGADGKFRGILTARPGKKVTVSLGDVDGYRFDGSKKVTETLEVKKGYSEDKKRGVPILMNAAAVSTRQTYFVWIHANCDHEYLDEEACRDLPIRRDGDIVMRTDRTGHAYFPITASSGKEVEITLDTPTEAETIAAAKEAGETDPDGYTMRPQDPTYRFELGYEPKAFVIEAEFEDPEAEEEATAWQPPPDPEPESANDSSSSDEQTSESDSDKTDNSGPIDLFGD